MNSDFEQRKIEADEAAADLAAHILAKHGISKPITKHKATRLVNKVLSEEDQLIREYVSKILFEMAADLGV